MGGGERRVKGFSFVLFTPLDPRRHPTPPPTLRHTPLLSHTMVRAIINYVKSTAAAIVR